MLSTADGYYFIANVHEPANYLGPKIEEARLVKLNSSLEVVFTKVLDKNRVEEGHSYICQYNNDLLTIGPGNWNNVPGLSFIRTDANGVIRSD